METNAYNDTILVYWPVMLWLGYFVLLPIGFGLANLICQWLDDGEESFQYPHICMMPVFSGGWFVKAYRYEWVASKGGEYTPDAYDVEKVIGIGALGIGCTGGFLVGLLCIIDETLIPLLIEGICAGSVFLILAKKVLRIGKKLNKHINNEQIHNKE